MDQASNRYSGKLLFFGMLLFTDGLVTGALVPFFLNSRMGLSAHLAGVQNGLVLLVVGLMWKQLSLSAVWLRVTYYLNLFSMYVIWISLVLAAAWGTSRSTPIAGEGFESSAMKEAVVQISITSGSVAALIAAILMLVGLFSKLREA